MSSNTTTSIMISPTTKAVGLIALSTFMYSTLPLSIALLGIASPFLFMTAWLIGRVVLLWVILLFGYPKYFLDKEVWKLAWRHCFSWIMFFWVAAAWAYALFAYSAGLIEVSVTTVLYEIRPVLLIMITGWLFRDDVRYYKTGAVVYFAFILAVGGAGVVVMSQSSTWQSVTDGDLFTAFDLESTLGILLAFGAAVFAAMSAFGLRWAVNFADKLPDVPVHARRSREIFGVFIGTSFNSIFGTPFIAIIGFARNEPADLSALALSLLVIPLLDIMATATWRMGNLMTERLGVNVVLYFTPLLSLFFLLLFGQVQDVSLPFLFIGATIIIAANTLVFVATRDVPEAPSLKSEDIISVNELIASGESGALEFKSTLRMNLYTQQRDQRIEQAAIKTLAAFLNSDGGTLVIGVADEGRPARSREDGQIGIDIDGFRNEDQMSLHLRNIVTGRMGAIAMSYIHPSFHDFEGERIMLVRCEPSIQPVYVAEGNTERFYIRTGPSTTELAISDSVTYIRDNFPR